MRITFLRMARRMDGNGVAMVFEGGMGWEELTEFGTSFRRALHLVPFYTLKVCSLG